MATVERILACIADGPIAKVENMLLALYDAQTADEQASESTNHTNGVGFNGTDAGFLTSLAKQVLAFRAERQHRYPEALSVRQQAALRKALRKYAGQLARAAAPAPAPAPVGPPPGIPCDDAAFALFTDAQYDTAATAYLAAVTTAPETAIAVSVAPSTPRAVAVEQVSPRDEDEACIAATVAVLDAAATLDTRPVTLSDVMTDASVKADAVAMACGIACLTDKELLDSVMQTAVTEFHAGRMNTSAQRAYRAYQLHRAPGKPRRVKNTGIRRG